MNKKNHNDIVSSTLKKAQDTSTSYVSFPWKHQDVAKAYSVSTRTVANWCSGRRIPYLKVGRSVRFNPEAVSQALKRLVIREVSHD